MISKNNRISLVLYKMTDLRLLDHHPLYYAHNESNKVCHIFFFDPRFTSGVSKFGNHKMTSLRSKFLKESVQDLKINLKNKGSDLYTFLGYPEEILPKIVDEHKIDTIYYYQETCKEEMDVIKKIKQNCSVSFKEFWGNTLYEIDDLPYSIKNMPTIYTIFRKSVEENCQVKMPLQIPILKQNIEIKNSLEQLPSDEQLKVKIVDDCDKRAVLQFKGGETSGIERLNQYFWKQDLLRIYKETRNGMIGADYSSKFSPWLALGCISPRFIISEIKKYEKQREQNESTYWLFFELLWRDFFRFHSLQQGNRIFLLYGTHPNPPQREWKKDMKLFDAWKNGKTGYPLIDANMIELKSTGFMSNRGRQIVASFLVHDLGLDWRMGAQHFESYLLDYDPCSNYGNWNYSAGVGSDPRENRYFNIVKQGKNYDPQCQYIWHWLPELKKISNVKTIDISLLTQEQRIQDNLNYELPIASLLHNYFDPANKMKQQHGKVQGKQKQKQPYQKQEQDVLIQQVENKTQKKKRIRNKKQDQIPE